MNGRQMTPTQARQVLWLRSNPRYHRPLGELLDEGYLTKDRLRWAAEYAYNNELRQAAAVLLADLGESSTGAGPTSERAQPRLPDLPVPKLPITLARARATIWPFRDLKGQPMGALLDANRLGLKDLAYAAENAWDRRVRDAALALMTVRIGQLAAEPEGRGHLRVVSEGKSYSETRELDLTMAQGALAGGIVVVWLELVAFLVVRTVRDPSWLLPKLRTDTIPLALGIAITAASLAIVLWVVKRIESLDDRMDEQIENARRGQEGEEAMTEALRQNLDGDWTLFRNVTLPGRNPADIDGVLVGPPGVWALEAKNLSGPYRAIGEHWQRRVGKQWKRFKKSPSRQAINNAARLSEFLKADGIKQWVNPVVVWVNREHAPQVKQPAVPIWTWDRLPEELGNLWANKALREDQAARIVDKLTDLAEREAQAR